MSASWPRCRAWGLIIDDFGLKPLRAPADEDLHDLVAERYERAATIVTSNLNFDEWDQAFTSKRLLASATLDRLRHNAYCLELDGPSYHDPKVAPAAKNGLAKRLEKATQKGGEPRQNATVNRVLRDALARRTTWPVYADSGWPDYADY